MKIGLDIDDVLADFWNSYLLKFGNPESDYAVTRNVQRILKTDKEFWTTLPVVNIPDFVPELYCTKRVNSKTYTKIWLKEHGFPNRPVYQVYYQKGNKANYIKGKIDVFVDDSVSNMIAMNLSGVPCLLMDTVNNQNWGPVGRIFSLQKSEIESAYHLFLDTIYPCFKKYVEWNKAAANN